MTGPGTPEDRKLGGGDIFIYSCYAQLISFEIEIKILKSIVFTVCEQEYMNICPPPPPPPNYRSSGVPGLGRNLVAYYQLYEFRTV